jgi:hypothetical protein
MLTSGPMDPPRRDRQMQEDAEADDEDHHPSHREPQSGQSHNLVL